MYGAGDYKMDHSCGSEVAYSACFCIFIKYILYFQICTLLLIATSTPAHNCGNTEVMHLLYVYIFMLLSDLLLVIISSTLVHICGKSEITHSLCAQYYQAHFQILYTSGDCRIYTPVHSCRHSGEVLHSAWTLYFIKYTFKYLKLRSWGLENFTSAYDLWSIHYFYPWMWWFTDFYNKFYIEWCMNFWFRCAHFIIIECIV